MNRSVAISLVTAWTVCFCFDVRLKGDEPHKVALLVGVNHYQKRGFSDLAYAEQDVEELAVELKKLGFDVVLLKGSAKGALQATRENIDAQLELLLKPVTKQDVVLVALSGHGQQLAVKRADGTDKEDAFYCPVDAVKDTPKSLLSLSYLLDEVLAKHGGRNLVLVDACRDVPKDPTRGAKGVQGKVIALPEDTAVLFSCRAGQQSYESDKLKHGVFTRCVLEGLRGKAATGREITWERLVAHVSDQISSAEMRTRLPAGSRQDPISTGGVGRLVLGQLRLSESIGINLVTVKPGEFLMGSPSSDQDRKDGEQQHRVRLTGEYLLGAHEVTVGQFRTFVQQENYKTDAEKDGQGGFGWDELRHSIEGPFPQVNWRNPGFEQTDEHPVVNVSWNDAQAFCRWLNREERELTFRLPTEAEWEYACRAGTITRFHSGDDRESLATMGNLLDATAKPELREYVPKAFIAASDRYVFTAPRGRFRPNTWGFFDMHGNVCEWCADGYDKDYYKTSPLVDPPGPDKAATYSIRGGGWHFTGAECRSAARFGSAPEFRFNSLGFRVAADRYSRPPRPPLLPPLP